MIDKYEKLCKEGYTILGLYKIGKEDGLKPDEIVGMLEKVLPLEKSIHYSHDQIVKFMRKMEFGEEYCMACQKFFIDKAGQWCNHYCPECQKFIDKMWEKVYDTQKETGEELDEESMTSIGVWMMIAAGLKDSLVVPEK